MVRTNIKEKQWSDYDIGDPTQTGQSELAAAVRRAAKAANQRLLRLERAGYTSGVYAQAMYDLVDRRRYKESTKNLTLNQLRHEYRILRNFLSAKTSTIQGRLDTIMKRYRTAQEKGFSGTLEEFEFAVTKYFTDAVESLFSSDVIYSSITSGNTDIIDEAVKKYGEDGKDNRGAATLYYLRRKKNKCVEVKT